MPRFRRAFERLDGCPAFPYLTTLVGNEDTPDRGTE
jgi:hypothetical protein